MIKPVAAIPFNDASYPIVIHRQSSVAIAAPRELREEGAEAGSSAAVRSASWVRGVAIRKVAGPETGRTYVQPCVGARASFQNLSAGTYDVFYLDAATLQALKACAPAQQEKELAAASPQRRILVEQTQISAGASDVPWRTNGDVSTVAAGGTPPPAVARTSLPRTRLGMAAVDPVTEGRTQRAWQLLALHSWFNARREFTQAIEQYCKSCPLPATRQQGELPPKGMFSAAEILSGSSAVLDQLRTGEGKHEIVAGELVNAVGRQEKLAQSLYGLGKAYEAISAESTALVEGADDLALVCFHAAHQLDPQSVAALNDLGVLYYRRGRLEPACRWLTLAARAESEVSCAYNLGRVLQDLGRVNEAESCWHWVLERQTGCKEALVAWIHLALGPNSPAQYAEQCRTLGINLGCLLEVYGADSPEGKWAKAALRHLEVLGHELRLNSPSVTGELWLAYGSKIKHARLTETAVVTNEPASAPRAIVLPVNAELPLVVSASARPAAAPTARILAVQSRSAGQARSEPKRLGNGIDTSRRLIIPPDTAAGGEGKT